jgi:hypothetical protein
MGPVGDPAALQDLTMRKVQFTSHDLFAAEPTRATPEEKQYERQLQQIQSCLKTSAPE